MGEADTWGTRESDEHGDRRDRGGARRQLEGSEPQQGLERTRSRRRGTGSRIEASSRGRSAAVGAGGVIR